MQRGAVHLARRVADAIAPGPISRHEHADLSAVGDARGRAASRLAHITTGPRPRRFISTRRRLVRRQLVLRLTSDRALPVAIGLIVLLAAGVSLAPAAQPVGAAAAQQQPLRLAIGGPGVAPRTVNELNEGSFEADNPGYLDDGTLYKPVSVDTSVQTSAALLRHYTVRDGDTLTGIASKFGVSMMTVWWANKLTSKALHVGQDLVIPPVNGLVVTVAAGDTLDSLATEYKVTMEDIIAVNDLQDPNLIVGQVLVLPGAKGDPIPTPTPTPKPVVKRTTTSTTRAPVYTGGAWAWPVIGGGNYVSQYFHYGHYGIDIAADYGSTIVSPLAGKVVFAGWKSNGGGYQVWISHGNGIFTGSHHMSAVLVSTGQSVSRGQRVGRVGQSGWATGPHDHFEVWIGFPWESGSYRVNPLRYY